MSIDDNLNVYVYI